MGKLIDHRAWCYTFQHCRQKCTILHSPQIHLSHWFHKMVNFCTNQNNFKYCILSWCENVLSPSQTSKIEKIEHFLPILILNKIPRLPFNIDSPLIEVHFNWENLIWDFYSPLSEVLLCCWVKSSRSSSIT